MNTKELRKAAKCVFLACPEPVARDLSDKLHWAANKIDKQACTCHEGRFWQDKLAKFCGNCGGRLTK